VIPGTVIPEPPPEPSAPPGLPPTRPPASAAMPAASAGEDPLDSIAKLAQLRDTGALTEEEYEREKAKLLAQM